MFFRFAAALVLVVLVSMTSVVIEKRTLELRRQISLQYYQTDLMIELQVQLRLEAQKLLAPSLAHPDAGSALVANDSGTGRSAAQPPSARPSAEADSRRIEPPKDDQKDSSRLPLLRFQQPFRPEGID